MATANVSSTFDITIVGPNDLNVAKTFTATRGFTVTGISVNNIAAAASTLIITNAGAQLCATTAAPPLAGTGIVQAQAVAGPVSSVAVFGTNATVAPGAEVVVTTGHPTVTTVILHCTAGGLGESITIA